MIALIDYGSGNIRSVYKALTKVGADVQLANHPALIDQAAAVVLPGVGAFDDCVNALQAQDLFTKICDFINSGRPFLGICVGYQALFEKSFEFNSRATGLSIFRGPVVRFPQEPGLKVPQIGWNQIEIVQTDCPLFQDIPDKSYVYFVHSYYPQPLDQSIIATRTNYGPSFASAVWRDNVFATQFHPEKSQSIGLKLMHNFVQLL
jgi:imidazole glycerol-phosphate synthase subunit HisH